MSSHQQETFIRNLTALECELFALEFKQIGSLYLQLDGSFVVGPDASSLKKWSPTFGPWSFAADYIKAAPKYELDFMGRDLQGWIECRKGYPLERETLIDTEMMK